MKNITFLLFLVPILIVGSYISFEQNPHSVQWFIAASFNLGLVIFVYFRDKSNKLNISFSLLGFSIFLWVLGVFGLYISPSQRFAMNWSKVFSLGMIFVPPTFLQFISQLTKAREKAVKLIVKSSFIGSLFFALLDVAGIFTPEWYKSGLKYSPKPTFLYIIFLIYLALVCSYGLYVTFNKYKISLSFKERNQYKYVFLGSAVVLFFGLLNLLLSYGVKFYPVGGLGVIFFTSTIAYAIVKHQLMDINIVIRRGIIYTALTLSVGGIYALVVGVFTGLFGMSRMASINNLFINGLAGLIIALVFSGLREKIQFGVDRLFFKERYNYQKVLSNFSNELTSILELSRLLDLLVSMILDVMHISRGYVLLLDDKKEEFRVKSFRSDFSEDIVNFRISRSDNLVGWLEKNKKPFIVESRADLQFDELKQHRIALCIPLITKNELIGVFLLGNKLSEDAYTSEDVELLTTVTNQASIAIENAKLYESQIEIEKNLSQSDKLIALGTMASSIMHEIKNPLVAIKTFTQVFPKKYNDLEFIGKFKDIVPKELERMENFLSELLDYSRRSIKTEYARVNVERVMEDVLFLLNNELSRHKIKIIKELGNVPDINGNSDQLKQVFINLALNASQAMDGGGALRITTAIAKNEGKDSVSIRFEDTGCGIPKENLDSIFNPFFTTRKNGTGLGLSIVRKIVREHKGTIEVESPPKDREKGSAFIILLPISK